jgi:CHAT domain-containing protein
VVAPSLAIWLRLKQRPASRRRKTVLVAGPRLRHSRAEVRSLARLNPGATVLEGKEATARAVLAALDSAELAHLACHGTFRADSPLFSSLELADGPLNVYELQRLRRPPEVVVLSSCDLAVSDVRPGDELLGLASALLGMGTRAIVASVVPVPDAGTRWLMDDLHRHLIAGERIAAALAAAQAGRPEAGFVCLGAG